MRMGFEGPNEIVPTAQAGDSSNRAANTAFVVANTVGSVIASTGLGQSNTTGTVTLFTNMTATTASLVADVAMTSGTITVYFAGPSVAQGTTGTWVASGTVTVVDPAAAFRSNAKLWDGTTIIASAQITSPAAGFLEAVSLSGFITSPAGNLRIDVSANTATAKIIFNGTGNSKDSTITAVRIA